MTLLARERDSKHTVHGVTSVGTVTRTHCPNYNDKRITRTDDSSVLRCTEDVVGLRLFGQRRELFHSVYYIFIQFNEALKLMSMKRCVVKTLLSKLRGEKNVFPTLPPNRSGM